MVGGVASNKELRRRLAGIIENRTRLMNVGSINQTKWSLIFPPIPLCTDNGVMAAWAGIEKVKLGLTDSVEDQDVISRWPLGTILNSTV